METQIMYSFIHKLFTGAYGGKRISVHLNSADNVLTTDLSFEYKDYQISEDKQKITLYGEDDLQVTVTPQNLMDASTEDEYYLFNTDTFNMAVTFI